jgi:hypothetical protein
VVASVLAGLAVVPAAASAQTTRKVYIAGVDASGAPVTDLTAADIAVKEDGKVREVAGLARATEPLDVHLFVDDQGTGAYQPGVLAFLQALIERANFTIYQFKPQAVKLLDASHDFDGIQAALNALGPRGRVEMRGEQIVEALGTTARALQQSRPARPVIMVFTVGGDSGHANPDIILNQLRHSGASVNVIYLQTAGIGLVLGDSPDDTGGQNIRIGSVNAVGPAVKTITDALLNQYALTYTLPAGVEPSDRVEIGATRAGVTLLAPEWIPER